jgi:hypothetical protein
MATHTHKHTLSLSLSHTHTHTHTSLYSPNRWTHINSVRFPSKTMKRSYLSNTIVKCVLHWGLSVWVASIQTDLLIMVFVCLSPFNPPFNFCVLRVVC